MKFSTALIGGLSLAGLASAIPTSERGTPHPKAGPNPEYLKELLARTANNQRRAKLQNSTHGHVWNATAHAPGGKHYDSKVTYEKPKDGKTAKKSSKYKNHTGHKKGKGGSKGGKGVSKPGSGHGDGTSPTSPPVGIPTATPDDEEEDTCPSACPAPFDNSIEAPEANIWLGLTHDEAAAVTSFLFAQESLNLTISEDATEWDNTL